MEKAKYAGMGICHTCGIPLIGTEVFCNQHKIEYLEERVKRAETTVKELKKHFEDLDTREKHVWKNDCIRASARAETARSRARAWKESATNWRDQATSYQRLYRAKRKEIEVLRLNLTNATKNNEKRNKALLLAATLVDELCERFFLFDKIDWPSELNQLAKRIRRGK
jgi:chromosome segregation ATPase